MSIPLFRTALSVFQPTMRSAYIIFIIIMIIIIVVHRMNVAFPNAVCALYYVSTFII